MGTIASSYRDTMLDALPATQYLALFVGDPAGAGTECSGTGLCAHRRNDGCRVWRFARQLKRPARLSLSARVAGRPASTMARSTRQAPADR